MDADPLVGQNVGGYVVEQLLGAGGMGLVYRARHPILNRRFAVKVLRPEVAAEPVVHANFIREAQVLSSLKHPHIIDIVGFGALEAGPQYMVMEFLEGLTLADALALEGKMTPARALALADQILDGLAAAHSVDVVHRDLKPHNVFLAKVSGGRELVKLLDFGLAKALPQAMGAHAPTIAGGSVVAGTPEYVAPEQAQGRQASRYSDLYSFGVVLYEMLTGALPYDATGENRVTELLRKKASHEAPSIAASAAAFAFPYELEVVVADLLKPDPADRPSSADTVRSRLQRVGRALQSHATQQHPLAPTEAMLLSAQKQDVVLERVATMRGGTQQLFPEPAVKKRSRASRAVVPLLLVAGGWWMLGGEPAPALAPEIVDAPSPPEPAPEPALSDPPLSDPPLTEAAPPLSADPDLLAALTHPRKAGPAIHRIGKHSSSTPPSKAHGLTVSIAEGTEARADVQIQRARCEPNDRWKLAARAHLQEIQAAAARTGDASAWARFEAAEGPLAAAVAKAASGVECEAVDRDIAQLARQFSP